MQLELYLDTDTLTLQDLVDKVLKRRLGINEPTVGLGSTTLYEEGEGADERLEVNLVKLLKVSGVWTVVRTSKNLVTKTRGRENCVPGGWRKPPG